MMNKYEFYYGIAQMIKDMQDINDEITGDQWFDLMLKLLEIIGDEVLAARFVSHIHCSDSSVSSSSSSVSESQ